jgi:hypothetical protein
MPKAANTLPPLKWVYISGVAFAVAMAAVVAFVAYAGRTRLPNGLYFMILIPLGLTAAAFLFGAMRSHAAYRGESSYGTLELGGPVVVLALVVLGGLMANRAETFALTVRVHGPDGPGDVVRSGRITADLAGVRRTADLSANGDVVFADVPAELDGDTIQLLAEANDYMLAPDAGRVVIPASHIVALALRRKEFLVTMRGSVRDGDGRAVRGARLDFNAGAATTSSDSSGNFIVRVANAPGTVIPLTVSRGEVVLFDENVTVAEQPALRIVLRRVR